MHTRTGIPIHIEIDLDVGLILYGIILLYLVRSRIRILEGRCRDDCGFRWDGIGTWQVAASMESTSSRPRTRPRLDTQT